MESEIWTPYPYEQNYLVSNYGKVFSKKTNKLLKLKFHKISSKEKPKHNRVNNNYLLVSISINGISKWEYVHRVVATTYIYNTDPQNKTQVNHIDGNKANNCISNLEWVTPTENCNHAIKTGLKIPQPVTEEVKRKLRESVPKRFINNKYSDKHTEIASINWRDELLEIFPNPATASHKLKIIKRRTVAAQICRFKKLLTRPKRRNYPYWFAYLPDYKEYINL